MPNDGIFAGKKQLWLLCPRQARLTHSELLVYSYRAWQDAWHEQPAVLKVVKATGLSRNTVRRADRRLQQQGLLGSDHAVPEPPEGAFVPADRDGDHWFQRLQYWVCYVRRLDAALTHVQTALLSFLWHCHATDFHPHFSCAYLATVLCVYRETVAEALEALEARGLLSYTTHERGVTFVLRKMEDLSFLHDVVRQRTGNRARSVMVSDESAPMGATMASARSRTSEDVLAKTVTRDKIASELRRILPEEAERLAGELFDSRACREDKWGWYLEFSRLVNDERRNPTALDGKLRQRMHGEWNGAVR
jgi:DNA-binding transcriptional regulator YhcF (GntR family)